MVFASIPVASDRRFAARPVGAASRILAPASRNAVIMPSVVVVFPVPGPPVRIRTLCCTADRIACCWI